MNKAVKGDYIGFTFGGVHFSGLGLMRISDGSRYSTYLLPAINNKTVQVPGKDGSYLFESTFGNMEITINTAFDSVSEKDKRKITQLLGDKRPHSLWFDETPYKEYIAIISKQPQMKWICIDDSRNSGKMVDGITENDLKRMYKGELSLQFTCYTPTARSRINFLDDPVESILWGYGKGSGREYVLTEIKAFTEDRENNNETYPKGSILYKDYGILDNSQSKGYFSNGERKIPLFIEEFEDEEGKYFIWQEDNGKKRGEFLPKTGFREAEGYYIGCQPLTYEFNYNFNEWKEASKLRYKQIDEELYYNTFIENDEISKAILYNAGDQDTDLKIKYNFQNTENKKFSGEFKLYKVNSIDKSLEAETPLAQIKIKEFTLINGDNGIVLDSKLKLIVGTRDGIPSGTVYNKYHEEGDFFKLPITEENEYLILTSSIEDINNLSVEYKHIYY